MRRDQLNVDPLQEIVTLLSKNLIAIGLHWMCSLTLRNVILDTLFKFKPLLEQIFLSIFPFNCRL